MTPLPPGPTRFKFKFACFITELDPLIIDFQKLALCPSPLASSLPVSELDPRTVVLQKPGQGYGEGWFVSLGSKLMPLEEALVTSRLSVLHQHQLTSQHFATQLPSQA